MDSRSKSIKPMYLLHSSYSIGFVYLGTMSQQNRKAFMITTVSSKHERGKPNTISNLNNIETDNDYYTTTKQF